MKFYNPKQIEEMRDNLIERFMNEFWLEGLHGTDAEELAGDEVDKMSDFMVIHLYNALGEYGV